ncbi:MAG: ubiquitin-like small modifier protein 1 [Elusimicrobiota bacterium]
MTKVLIPQPLRKHTDNKSALEISGKSIDEVLKELEKKYPDIEERLRDEEGNLRRFINIFVNGKDIRLEEGENTPVSDEDEVSILPAIAGG